MLEELDAVIERFLQESYSDFADLDTWFREVIAKYGVPQDGFEKHFVATLAYAGWFIFAFGELLPKLHRARCLAAETYLPLVRQHRTRDICRAATARTLSEISGFIQMHDRLL